MKFDASNRQTSSCFESWRRLSFHVGFEAVAGLTRRPQAARSTSLMRIECALPRGRSDRRTSSWSAKSGPLPQASCLPPRSKEQTFLKALFDGLRWSPSSSRIQVIASAHQYGVRPATRSAYTKAGSHAPVISDQKRIKSYRETRTNQNRCLNRQSGTELRVIVSLIGGLPLN